MITLGFVRVVGGCTLVAIAAAVAACSVDTVVDPFEPGPAPSASSSQKPAPSTTSPAPSASATPDAQAPDAAPPKDAGNGKDVLGSAECKAWCDAKVAAGCRACDTLDCQIARGSCDAAERAYLDCQAKTGRFSCASGGMSIVHNCKRDLSLCD